jgi:hypothetical protein
MKTRMTVFVLLVSITVVAAPLGTEFTYQGVLSDGGAPASGVFDFRFFLYDAEAGGSQVGSVVLIEDLTVTDGRVTAQLDFGSVFDGTALWLEVGVRDGVSTGAYTVLSPRQELTAAPFAQHAATAEVATIAGHAATANYADWADDSDFLNSQNGIYYLTWSNFIGIPGDLADGDDDSLADLSCSAEEIARWNGSAWNCSSDDDTPYARTYVVSPVGTTTQNGTALRNAIAAITPPYTQENAVLLKLEPGVYDVGDTGIEIGWWMTVQGAGRGLTKITGAVCQTNPVVFSIVWPHAGVRTLTIANTCSDGGASASVLGVSADDVTVESVRLEATGASNVNRGLVTNPGTSDLRLNDVEISAEDGVFGNMGVLNWTDNATFDNVTVEATGGNQAVAFYNQGDSVTVKMSRLESSGGSVYSYGLECSNAPDLLIEQTEVAGESWGVRLNQVTGMLVDVLASGVTAIYIDNSAPITMTNVTADGVLAGIDSNTSDVSVMHGRAFGSLDSVRRLNSGAVTLEGVILHGGPVSGTVTCTACMRNGTFSASGCP